MFVWYGLGVCQFKLCFRISVFPSLGFHLIYENHIVQVSNRKPNCDWAWTFTYSWAVSGFPFCSWGYHGDCSLASMVRYIIKTQHKKICHTVKLLKLIHFEIVLKQSCFTLFLLCAGVRWCPLSLPSCWCSTPASTSSSTAGRTKLSGRFFSTNLDYLLVLSMVMIFTMKGDLNISSCGATLCLCVCLSVCPPFCVSSIYASMI